MTDSLWRSIHFNLKFETEFIGRDFKTTGISWRLSRDFCKINNLTKSKQRHSSNNDYSNRVCFISIFNQNFKINAYIRH